MNRFVAAVVTLALVAGCVAESRPASCEETTVSLELHVTADALRPAAPAVCRAQQVTLDISSEVDGVLHIHGYDAYVPATAISASEELRLSFTAERSGQFPVELHADDDPEGVSIGIFTVHEP